MTTASRNFFRTLRPDSKTPRRMVLDPSRLAKVPLHDGLPPEGRHDTSDRQEWPEG